MATSNKVDSENQSKVQGLNSYTKQELIDMIKYDIEEMLVENGIDDVSIVGIDLNGSRLRGDAREDSDLDVVVEYKGDFSEDGLFNILNEEPLTIEGVRIDINPITEEKSGTLEEYMQKSREYDQKILQQRQQPENVSIYNSDEARRIYDEILESERTSRKLVFPAHTGALGVFEEEGKYVAFDNTTNDCWVEEFWNENIAYSWVRGEMSADDAHEIDNNLHLEKETGKQENAIASESAEIVNMFTPDYSSYMNSKALYDAVQSLGSVSNKVLAGYMDYESNCYVFIGSGADIIGRYDRKHVGTLMYEDDISHPSEYMLPMSSAEGRSLFDQISASLVHKGYRLAVIEGDYVKELVEQEEIQEQKGKQSSVEVEQPLHVTSAVQLNLFSDADFETSQEQTLHKATEPKIGVPEQPQEAFDPTRLAMRQLDEGEQCYVERRYTENGYFSFAGGDHIESNADVAYIFRTLEDKSVENAFICMVKDGKPTVIHLGIGDATSVMAPIQDALLAYKALNPDKIWFIHNHPSGNLKVSREDFRLQQRMEEIFGDACQPGIIINTTSGQFMAYTAEYELGGEHLISEGQSGDKAIKTYSFDRSVFEKGWNPAKAFSGISPAGVAGFVASHRLGEHEKLSLLVLNQSGSITGNVFLPWKDIKDVCTQDGVETISQAVLQMGGNRCLLYGSEGALDNREIKALSVLQNRLKKYSIALHDVIAVERSLRMEGVIASESIEHPYVRDSSAEAERNGKHHHRLSPADREAGSALVDHLRDMGIIVHTDNRENRRILKAAQADRSETGKVRLLKNEQGDNYGFTYKGEVYLDLRKVDAELSLREYSYLWCEALRRVNPDNWNNVIETLKNDADTWSFIQAANPELHDDNDLATEAIARYSGKRGAERLQAELERMERRDDNYKSRWNNIFQNVSKAVQDFWKHIGDSLNYRYESKDDIADQILNDFAKQVNPVRKVEKWLADRDDIYADAVENDPDLAAQIFEEALQENIGNGITPFMAVDGYRGKLDRLAHEVKGQDNGEAIERAADLMAPLIPLYSVLVPAPSHKGMATDMLTLANAISRRTGSPVADVLKSEARESQYDAKRTTGKPLSAEALGIRMEGKLPTNYMPVVIDNVVHSGNTAEACVKALGKGVVLALASAVSQERHVASLKRLEPIVYDRDGQLIPLSKRFELKGRRLGKAEHKKGYKEGNKRERKGMNPNIRSKKGHKNLFSEVRNVVQWKPEQDLTIDQAMMVADHHGLHTEVEQDLMNGMEPELALQKHHIMPTAEKLAEIESLSDPCQIPVIDAVLMLLDRIIPNKGDELVLDGGGAHLDFQYIGFGYQQVEDVKSIKHVDNGYVASNGDQTINVSRLASGPDGEYFLKVIKDSIEQEKYSLSSDKVITKNSKTMAKKKSQEEEMKQQNGTEAKVESKPKKKVASKKSTEAKPEAGVKPEVEKKEEAKREKRPPQLVLEDGRQVTHVHTFPLKEEIGGGMGITGKIDGKELPTRRVSDEDAKKVEAKEVKPIDLLAKYYPNQVATQLSKEQLAAVDLNHGQKLDLDATKVWMMHKGADNKLINWQDYEKMTPEEKKGIENIPMMTLSVNGEKVGSKKITNEEYGLYVNKLVNKAELANKYFDVELSGGNKLSNGKTFEAWIKPSPNDAEVSLMHLKMDNLYVGAHKIKPEDAEKLQKGEVSQRDLVEKVFYNEIKGRVIELADGTKANVSVYQTRDGSPAVSLWSGNNNLGTQRIKPEEKAGIDNGTLKPTDLAKTYFADKINGQEQSQSQGMSR